MRIFPVAAAAVLASTALLATAGSASAKPDTSCMQAGIATLKSAGLLPAVAKGGVDLDYAVTELGVTVRPGKESMVASVPNPVPFSVLLADHRAGSNSIFVYPWCG
jgi:hypothetical protein